MPFNPENPTTDNVENDNLRAGTALPGVAPGERAVGWRLPGVCPVTFHGVAAFIGAGLRWNQWPEWIEITDSLASEYAMFWIWREILRFCSHAAKSEIGCIRQYGRE